ncbi:MAG: hypothetical protein U0992_14015 [Planctomycetaceae bacterium]
MAQPRKRRIARWIAAGLLAPVVLLSLYVCAYLAAAWFEGYRYGGDPVIRNLAVFSPLQEYGSSDAPGGLEFKAAEMYFVNGGSVPPMRVYEVAKELRKAGRL